MGSDKPSRPQNPGSNGTAGESIVLHVDRDFTMVGTARRQLQRWLRERGCSSADDAMLVLSELVTNALVHAGADCTIKLHHADDLLRLDVRDPSPAPPTIRSDRSDNFGGRGLRLVAAIAQAWGWEPTDCGKRVWAHVAAPVRRDAANNHLPS